MTLTLSELNQTLALQRIHPLTPTNVLGVSHAGGSLCFEFDQSELEECRADLKANEQELADIEKQAERAEERADAAEALLAEIKSPDGKTLAEYVSEAKQAEERAAMYKRHAEECERVSATLRKRKGIDVAYIKHRSEVMALLGYLEYEGEPRAKELLKKMRGGA